MMVCSAEGMISLILDSLLYLVYFLVAFSMLNPRGSTSFIYLPLRCVRRCTTILRDKLWIGLAAERDLVQVLLTTTWRWFFTRVVPEWLEVEFLLEIIHVSHDRGGKLGRARQPISIVKPLGFILHELRTRIVSKNEIFYMLEELAMEEAGSDEDEGTGSNLGATGRRHYVRMHAIDTAHVKTTTILAGLRPALMCCYRGTQAKSRDTHTPKMFPFEHHEGVVCLIPQLEEGRTTLLSTKGSAMTVWVSRGMIGAKRHGLSRPRSPRTGGGVHCTRGKPQPVRRASPVESSAEDSDLAVALDLQRGAWTTWMCGRIDGSASSCCVLVSMLPGSVPRPCHRRRNAAEASTIDTASSVGMVAASVASYAAPTGREGVYLTFASQATHDAAFVSSIHPHQAGFPPFVSVPALGHTVVEAVGATEVKTETLVVEPRRHGCSREGLGGQAEKLRQASRVRTLRSIRAEAARWRSNRYNKKEGGLRRSEAMMWMALVGGSAASAGGGHAGQPPEGPLRRTVPCPARPSKLPSSGRSVRYSATRTGLELEVRCRGGERSGMKTILGRRRSRQLRHQSGRDRMVKASFSRRERLRSFSSRWPGRSSGSPSTNMMALGRANSAIHLIPVSLSVDDGLPERPVLASCPGTLPGWSSDGDRDSSDRRAEDRELSSYLKHFWVGEKFVRVSSRGFNKSSTLRPGKMAKLGGFLTDVLSKEKGSTKIRREPAGNSDHDREDKSGRGGSLATRPVAAMGGCHRAIQGRAFAPAGDPERAHRGKDKDMNKSGVYRRLRRRISGVKEGKSGNVGGRKEPWGPSAAELLRLPTPTLMGHRGDVSSEPLWVGRTPGEEHSMTEDVRGICSRRIKGHLS